MTTRKRATNKASNPHQQTNPDSADNVSNITKTRDVIKQSPHRITGGHTVPDLSDHPLGRESDLEQQTIKQIICCHDISGVESQQTREYVDPDGVVRKYTPDLCAMVGRTERDVEVKPLIVLLDPEKRLHYAMLSKCLHASGRQLDFMTDDQVTNSPRDATADLLKRYRCHPIAEAGLQYLKRILGNGPITIRSILTERGSPVSLADIYAAVSQRHLWIDWGIPLSTASLVALPHRGFGGLSYEDVLYSGRHGLVLEKLVLGC